jgi:hypothetical protein
MQLLTMNESKYLTEGIILESANARNSLSNYFIRTASKQHRVRTRLQCPCSEFLWGRARVMAQEQHPNLRSMALLGIRPTLPAAFRYSPRLSRPSLCDIFRIPGTIQKSRYLVTKPCGNAIRGVACILLRVPDPNECKGAAKERAEIVSGRTYPSTTPA